MPLDARRSPVNGERRRTGKVISPINRITVAFPFSHIALPRPDDDVAELAGLVEEMADLLVKASPGAKATAIQKRARMLADRLE